MKLQKTLRGIALGAIFLVPIFALVVANSYFFPFITGKAFYFRILVEIAFAAWLILAALDAKYRPKLSPLTIGITIFAVVTLAADLLGVNPLRSLWSNFERMEGWITIIHLWAFFIVVSSIFGGSADAKSLWRRWFKAELGVAMFVSLYGMLQLAGVLAIHQGSTRIDATLGNAIYMAVYMLINIGIALYLFQSEKTKRRFKIEPKEMWIYWVSFVVAVLAALALLSSNDGTSSFFQLLGAFAGAHILWFIVGIIVTIASLLYPYLVLPVLCSFLLFETGTRGTSLGWIGGLMLALFVYALAAPKEAKRSRSVSAGILILVVVVGGSLWLLRGQPFVKNNDVLGRLANISLSDNETTARLYIWQSALTGWTDRPVLGWGQENFNYIFNANYNPHMWNQEQWFDRAHSVYLDWLTSSGLVGLLSYLSLYALFLIVVWKSSLTVTEKSLFTGLIAAYAIHNVFVFDNLASYVLFFILLAFMDSLRTSRPIRWLGTKPLSLESVEFIVAPVAIVALVFVVYFFNVRPIEANTRLIAALQVCGGPQSDAALFDSALSVNVYLAGQEIREQVLSCAGTVIHSQQMPDQIKQSFYTEALKAIAGQIAATPWKDARIYALGGSFENSINEFAPAEQLLTIAHELSPGKQSIDTELVDSELNTGQIDQAATLLAQAYQSDTTDGQVKDLYAVVLVADGKEALAHQLFGDDPSLFGTAQMAQAYTVVKEYQKAIAIDKALVAASPTDLNASVALAQLQFQAGLVSDSVQTLRQVEKDHPEYKDQIDATIKQVQSKK